MEATISDPTQNSVVTGCVSGLSVRRGLKRDRNRPGVIFWSIGNEEPHHTTEEGRRITRSLLAFVRKLDPSRPVVCAVDMPEKATVFEDIDVIGINYCYQAFDSIHRNQRKSIK